MRGHDVPVPKEALWSRYVDSVRMVLDEKEITPETARRVVRAYEENRQLRLRKIEAAGLDEPVKKIIAEPYDIGGILNGTSSLTPDEQRKRLQVAINQIKRQLTAVALPKFEGRTFEVVEAKSEQLREMLFKTLGLAE